MTDEQTVFDEFGFIAVFLIGCIFISILLGDNVLYYFLWLVLAGQLLLNWSVIENAIKEVIE